MKLKTTREPSRQGDGVSPAAAAAAAAAATAAGGLQYVYDSCGYEDMTSFLDVCLETNFALFFSYNVSLLHWLNFLRSEACKLFVADSQATREFSLNPSLYPDGFVLPRHRGEPAKPSGKKQQQRTGSAPTAFPSHSGVGLEEEESVGEEEEDRQRKKNGSKKKRKTPVALSAAAAAASAAVLLSGSESE